MTFSPEQLNFFKFCTVVLDELPLALRQVFAFMWDTRVASPPGIPNWDDSVTVLNILIAKEGGTKKVPTLNKSFKEWDCTALFKATLFAKTFAMPDGTGGVSTLDKLYVRPRGLSAGAFHPSVISPTGNQAETYALALDQLRLLRNTLCHQNNTQNIDKATFDNYIMLAKDAFTALGQDSTRIDEIRMMGEDEFPTAKQQQLEKELKKEKDAAIEFKQIEDHLTIIESQVEDVRLDMKNVETEVADINTQAKSIGSDMKELKANVAGIEQAIKAESSKGPWKPKSGIPEKIPHFIGRQKECQAIVDHLTDACSRLVDIWGPPGFGKTSVAKTVAHTLREMNVPVYFASLRGMTKKCHLVSTLLGIFADAKQEFHIPAPQYLIQCLQQQKNPFVLILDNADDLLESGDVELKEEVLRFIKEILAQCNHIKLLITSRESLDYLSNELPIHPERIGVLDEVSSDDLVKSFLPDVSESDRNGIVQVCGKVPLAMRLMCSVVTEENISVSELLEVLKTSPLFEVLDNESSSNDSRLKVIIDTCLARLGKQDRVAFVSLAVFSGNFGIEEAKNVLNLKNDQTKKRLRSLRRKSLIDCGDDLESCMIHSLFRSFVEENSKTDLETGAVFNKAKHFYNIYNFEVANERFLTGHSNEALAAFLDSRESIISSLVKGAKDGELYVKIVKVLSEAELLLFTALNDEELLFNSIYDAADQEATKKGNIVDKQKLLAAKSFGHWGWFFSDHQTWDISLQAGFTNAANWPAKLQCYYGVHQILSGKLEDGMSSLKSSVDRLTSSSNEDVLKELVYSVLENCQKRMEEHGEMPSHYENLCSSEPTTTTPSSTSQEDMHMTYLMDVLNDGIVDMLGAHLVSLVNQEEVDPAAGHRLFNSVVDLAVTMGRIHDGNGQLDAINLIKECTELLKHRAQRTRCASALTRGFLAGFYPTELIPVCFEQLLPSNLDRMTRPSDLYSVQKYNVTKLMIVSQLEMYRRLTDGGRRVVYNTAARALFFSPLACSLVRNMFENALKEYKEVPGADFDDLARSYHQLGALLLFMNDYSGAEELLQQALRLWEENSRDLVEISSTLAILGYVYLKTNNKAEAEKAFESALKLRKQVGVYDHADTAFIYYILGENHLSHGNLTKALQLQQKALELTKKHLGKHVLTACNFNGVGLVYLQMGDYDSAKEAFHKARDMNSELGEERNTAANCQNLADAYLESGSYEDSHSARAFCQEALVIWRKLGEHRETANSLSSLGCIHFKLGEFPAAIDAFQEASKLAKETLGVHTLTAEIFYSAGLILHKLGDNKSAVEKFQVASSIRSNLLGYHKDTAESYHWLGVAQNDMRDLDGALESLQTASRIRKQVLGDHPDTAESLNLRNRVYEDLSAKVFDCD